MDPFAPFIPAGVSDGRSQHNDRHFALKTVFDLLCAGFITALEVCLMTQVNPFAHKYYRQELEAFDVPDQEFGACRVVHRNINGTFQGYMYRSFGVYPSFPVFYIGEKLWMSLSPMEIESHYLPIKLAKGRVGVGGLGLGYYVQRILAKSTVKKVIVYELNQDVIDFYLHNFGQNPKLEIVKRDLRTLEDESFDFFYCDIYERLLDDRVLEDMVAITQRNKIKAYHFWGMEQMLAELVSAHCRVPTKLFAKPYWDFLYMLMAKHPQNQSFAGCGNWFYSQMVDLGLVQDKKVETLSSILRQPSLASISVSEE